MLPLWTNVTVFSERTFAAVKTAFATVPVEVSVFVAMVTAAFSAVRARARSLGGALGRLVGHHAESGVVPADGHVRKNFQNIFGQSFREFDGAELVEQLDAADVA